MIVPESSPFEVPAQSRLPLPETSEWQLGRTRARAKTSAADFRRTIAVGAGTVDDVDHADE